VYFFYKDLHVDERNGLGSVIVVEAEMSSDNLKKLLCTKDCNALFIVKDYSVSICMLKSYRDVESCPFEVLHLSGRSAIHRVGEPVVKVEFEIPVTPKLIDTICEIRRQGKLLGLTIRYELDVLVINNVVYEVPPTYKPIIVPQITLTPLIGYVYKVLPDGTSHHIMPFDDHEVTRLLKDLKYAEFIRFEVPIKPVPEPAIEVLQKAVKELKVAEELLYKCDYIKTLYTLRNIVLNHLTVEVWRGNQKERHLREELKNYILNVAPESYRSLYEEAIKGVENILRAVLHYMHRFVHKDTGELISTPLKEDVEYLYTTLLAVVKYLVQLTTRWAKQSSEAKS
jgi:hypothetical protein